jgi:hypothetical protein
MFEGEHRPDDKPQVRRQSKRGSRLDRGKIKAFTWLHGSAPVTKRVIHRANVTNKRI